jgi:hypothetical protein
MRARSWLEPAVIAMALGLLLDWQMHRFAGLRSAFVSDNQDPNEFINILTSHWAMILRQIPFRESWGFLIPWAYRSAPPSITVYVSHPALLVSLTALLESIFGNTPLAIRRFAIFLTALRLFCLYVFAHQAAREKKKASARLALFAFCLIPVAQLTARSLGFEALVSTLVLAALCCARAGLKFPAAALFAAALLTDWPAALFLPALVLALRESGAAWKRFAVVAGAAALVLPLLHYGFFLRGEMRGQVLVTSGVGHAGGVSFAFLLSHLAEHVSRLSTEALGAGIGSRLVSLLGFAVPVLALLGFAKRRESLAAKAFALAGALYVLLFYMIFQNHDYGALYLAVGLALLAAEPLAQTWNSKYEGAILSAALLICGIRTWSLPSFTNSQAEEYAAFRRDAEEMGKWIGQRTYLYWKVEGATPEPIINYVEGVPVFAGLTKPEELRPCPDFVLVSRAYLEKDALYGDRIRNAPECTKEAHANAHFLVTAGSCLCKP